ncbi:aspartate/glutamate racemase family protein [Natrinema sp. DC36]|uniref:aspartate/glutamate racemase family protein n=1 Tax=Natrinema sp. DC36 TaxID=2878680 RepID=UPI001CEFC667|nr:aspartate/glutamate racemase family protein [Natrinema sp. DC36]
MSFTEPQTIGILGGMSSESTRTYYRLIDRKVNDALGGHNAGDILIRSVNFARIERCIRDQRWEEAGELLVDAALDLEAGGADFVVMATNTMHRVAPRLVDELSIPFLHIVDAAVDAIRADGVETVGVLGTKAVMEGAFYHERFGSRGVETVVPGIDDREAVDRIIFEELTTGQVREESRGRYLDVIDGLVEKGARGIVLGCTEIELLVEQRDCPEIPLFDTTALHVDRAVERSLRPVLDD